MDDEAIKVYECLWNESRVEVPLEEAAVKFIELAEFFLRLVEYLPKDEDGLVRDETLAYCEWRYIVYLRFLYSYGLTPQERPPPWDVAMLMCCHLSSPTLLHHHLAINGHTSYGLAYVHFPIFELLSLARSGIWSHKKAQRDWDRFDGRRKVAPYRLPYQLWPVAPWDEDISKGTCTDVFSRLFKGSRQPQDRLRRSAVGGQQHPGIHMSSERDGQCLLTGQAVYTVEEYTKIRSDPKLTSQSCHHYPRHLTQREGCGLAPWPTVYHLKTSFYNQVALWTALLKAKAMSDSIIPRLSPAVGDYRHFIQLFGKEIDRLKVLNRKTFDPKVKASKEAADHDRLAPRLVLIPPTLEVSLLWHTHRLFPGTYWAWCAGEVGQVIDGDLVPSATIFDESLAQTRERWEELFPGRWPKTTFPTEQWADVYRPDGAVVGPSSGIRFISLKGVIIGYMPWRKRRQPRVVRERTDDGGGGYVGVSDGIGGGGGDGGGGGGGGGDGG